MTRVTEPKVDDGAAPAKKGKKNQYDLPEKVPEGTMFTDLAKGRWRIGPSIGLGGFGEIYAACKVGTKNYDVAVKCEPHGNGPLFVEMHFYLRNAKLDHIKQFKQKTGLKSLGMPYILANGSAELNGQKHRFIVTPRYGSDISKFFLANGRRLPEGTVYRLALQMLDVYQFIHGTGYIHADLKASNILLGLGKDDCAQAYLVDFGLASRYVTGEFKPDPKKAHNGTIEYTSRDAHLGVATRRSDLEILGYNLIVWLGVELPWETQKLLDVPRKVQRAKEAFMEDIGGSLKALFPQGVPSAIGDYMKYVSKLSHNQEPDYEKCRVMFQNALKEIKVPNSGDLDFKLRPQTNNNHSPPCTSKAAALKRAKKVESPILDSSLDEVIIVSDEEQEEDLNRPIKETSLAVANTQDEDETKISFSPAISQRGRPGGKTVIIDDLTPNPRSHKTYEFNFELDVSMDANVIVNVKRKRKIETSTPVSSRSMEEGTPVTRVNLRKVSGDDTDDETSSSGKSPRTPTVTLRKYKR